MLEQGGTVFDTAPGYGASEEVAAQGRQELGVRDKRVLGDEAQRRGPRCERRSGARAKSRSKRRSARIGRDKIDLIQVHNVADLATQFPILEEYKQAGRVRYIGTTSTFKPQYATLEQFMRDEPLDFIGIDYAVDNLDAEESDLSARAGARHRACSSICRSAARACGNASRATRCRRGPASSARRRGRSSS